MTMIEAPTLMPPAEYRAKPDWYVASGITDRVLPLAEVTQECKRRVERSAAIGTRVEHPPYGYTGCATPNGVVSCDVVRIDSEYVRIHEYAHCYGWPATHRGGVWNFRRDVVSDDYRGFPAAGDVGVDGVVVTLPAEYVPSQRRLASARAEVERIMAASRALPARPVSPLAPPQQPVVGRAGGYAVKAAVHVRWAERPSVAEMVADMPVPVPARVTLPDLGEPQPHVAKTVTVPGMAPMKPLPSPPAPDAIVLRPQWPAMVRQPFFTWERPR